jgi:hypothetical protein
MRFARVHVCIPGHPKFCAVGPEAVGYWAAALAYSCNHELDGHLPEHAIGAILALGPREGRALCERLVTAGLFERADGGYTIAEVGQKNPTKGQLDTRRRETAERMAALRRSRRSDVPRNASQTPSLLPSHEGGVLNSLSLNSLSHDLNSEERELRSPVRAHGPESSPPRTTIAPDLRLTPEARAAAEMLGVRDMEGEWVKFVAHHRGNGTLATDFYALWSKWAVMARNYERRERDRDARSSSRSSGLCSTASGRTRSCATRIRSRPIEADWCNLEAFAGGDPLRVKDPRTGASPVVRDPTRRFP